MRSKPMILVALLLAAFLVNLDTTLVNVALPALVRELHATTTQLLWVVDSFNLVFAALLLTFGSLSDRFGRKGMLLAGLTVFGAASLAGGFTTDPAQLIAARSVMGLGAAMAFPATLSLISNVFTERRERARAIGLWGAVAGVAIAMGPIAGGWLLEHFSWASIFIAMAPVAAAAAFVVALVVPTSKDPQAAAPDIAGLVLSSATMALLVFTIIEAPAYGWGAVRSLAGFAASAVLLAAFIVRERRAAHPMLDVRLFRNMRFSAAGAAVTVSFFTLLGFIFLMTQYFQFVRGYGPLSAGVHLLPVALSVGAGSVAGTQLAVRAGTKLIVTTGLVAMAGFYGWVAATTSTTIRTPNWMIWAPPITRSAWWPPTLACLRDQDTGGLYAFLDEAQRVFDRRGEVPIPLPPIVLDENIRNTRQIAQVFGSLGAAQARYRGMKGPPVRFIPCPQDEAIDQADSQVDRLLGEGWEPGQIALLVTGTRHQLQKEMIDYHGWDGYWDAFFTADDVFYGHVLGFKGLERPVVVLAVNGLRDESRLYVGLSRARSCLVVCGDLDQIAAVGGAILRQRLKASIAKPT